VAFGQNTRTVGLLLAAGMAMLSAATQSPAAEPLLTLALLTDDAVPGQTLESAHFTAALSLRTRFVAFKPSAPASMTLESPLVLAVDAAAPAEHPAEPLLRSVLVPDTDEAEETSRHGLLASARFQAGLGQIFPDRSDIIYGRNGTKLEEPSCGYLKISIRF